MKRPRERPAYLFMVEPKCPTCQGRLRTYKTVRLVELKLRYARCKVCGRRVVVRVR